MRKKYFLSFFKDKMQALPADIVRLINSDLSVAEIIQRCTVNKQFYAAICQNDNFWRTLARRLNVPEDRIAGKEIRELQQLAHNYERRPRLFNINHLALPDPQTGGFQVLIPFTSYRRSPVETVLDSILDTYQRTFTTRSRVKPTYRPGVVVRQPTIASIEEFIRRLNDVQRKLRENDFLRIGYTNYIVTGERGRLLVEPFTLTLVTLGFPQLLSNVYEVNGRRPLTLNMIGEYLPAEIDTKAITDYYNLGDVNDPVGKTRGIPMHMKRATRIP